LLIWSIVKNLAYWYSFNHSDDIPSHPILPLVFSECVL